MEKNSAIAPNFVRTSRTARITLAPAGQTQSIQRIPGAGIRFYIVEADTYDGILIKTDKTQSEFFTVGTGKEFSEEQAFNAVELENTTALAITILIFIGFGDYIDRRTTIVGNRLSSIMPVIEPATKLLGNAATTLAQNGTIILPGTPPDATYLRRKSIEVSNLDASGNLQILDDSGLVVALTVFPSTSIILPVSRPVTVRNVSGAPVALSVSEIWWMKP